MVIQEKAGIQEIGAFSQKDKVIQEGGGAYNKEYVRVWFWETAWLKGK